MGTENEHLLLPKGTILQGRYRVDEPLKSGGFGNTYIVWDLRFDERWAMKEFFMKGISEREGQTTSVSVSAASKSQFEAQRAKFNKEAKRLRKLNHPGIVRVEDLFDDNGTSYYIMDYIDGGSLSEFIKKNGPFSEERVRKLLPDLLDALEYVHAQQMWHLDIKPGNILMKGDGHPVLIDFGASKQLGIGGANSTSVGMSYTQGYAPSEQVDQNLDRIGPWTDIYALGATIYNLLSCNTPPMVSEIQESEAEAFDFPKDISDQMRSLILWMMNSNRRKRPQSVSEIRDYLSKDTKPTAQKDDEKTIIHQEPPKQASSDDDVTINEATFKKQETKPDTSLPTITVNTAPPAPKQEPTKVKEPTSFQSKPSSSNVLKYIFIICAIALLGCGVWWLTNRDNNATRSNKLNKKEVQRPVSEETTQFTEPDIKPEPDTITEPTEPVSKPTTFGTISITSIPSGASVKINGKNIGKTPLTLENQEPQTYNVELSAEGFDTETRKVTVTAGKTATCNAKLKAKQAQQQVAQQTSTQNAQPSSTSTHNNETANQTVSASTSNNTSTSAVSDASVSPAREETEENRIYDVVEENAEFPGGEGAYRKWLTNNLRYPAIAAEQGIQGRVSLSFVVNQDGSISDVKVLSSPDESLSKEAVRLAKAMPKWKPAKMDGKAVRSRYIMPVVFRLL